MARNKQEKDVIEEKELVQVVEDAYKDGKNLTMEQQAYLNIAYYAGKQWIAWDNANKRLFEPPKDPHKVRFVGNRIQPIVRTELAKITKNKPIVNVVPASGEDDDIKSSHLGQKLADWVYTELNLQEVNRDLAMWGLCTDIAFIKPFWNPSKGETLVSPGGQEAKQGDIDIDVVSIFDVKYDPTAKKWSEVKWVIHEKVRDVDYVKEVYDKEVSAEDGLASTNIFEAQLKNLNNLGTEVKQNKLNKSVRVKEYWEKPCSKYPRGRRITVANNALLLYVEDIGFGEEDKTERELPFFPFVHIVVPGRVNGMSVIENLMSVQKEYNKTRSQIIEHKNLMTNCKWVVEDGSIEDEITDEPGQVIEYKKGFAKPEPVRLPELSADVYKHLEECKEEFEFISGQHETSNGSVPTGVTSGVAVQLLQEQDDTKLGPTVQNYERCIELYMSYILKMIKIMYDVPRVIKVVGENNTVEVLSVKGEDLTSTDVRVQAGSSLPQSKAAKQQWILNLIDKGVLNAQTDRDLILKMLEMGTSDDAYSDYAIDVNQAQNENDRFKKGDITPKVRDFYNHAIHIKEHDKFRKSNDYEELPTELQKIIDLHVTQHENFIMQVMPPDPNEMPQGNESMPMESQPPMI